MAEQQKKNNAYIFGAKKNDKPIPAMSKEKYEAAIKSAEKYIREK